jgi:hypothetical protein
VETDLTVWFNYHPRMLVVYVLLYVLFVIFCCCLLKILMCISGCMKCNSISIITAIKSGGLKWLGHL